jgi:hypothetical protein
MSDSGHDRSSGEERKEKKRVGVVGGESARQFIEKPYPTFFSGNVLVKPVLENVPRESLRSSVAVIMTSRQAA